MFSLKTLAILAAIALAAEAHFIFTFPEGREENEDGWSEVCGGTNQSATRTPFPIGKGQVNIISTHAEAEWTVTLTLNPHPNSFSDFKYVLHKSVEIVGSDVCLATNIKKTVPWVRNGQRATIQVESNGDEGPLYACADVTLSTTATAPKACATIV